MKIGQEIVVEEERILQSIVGGKITTVKKGDKALIMKDGIQYLSGEARGKIVFDEENRTEYDVENIVKRISKIILHGLGNSDFEDYLEDIGVSFEDIEDLIAEELENYI